MAASGPPPIEPETKKARIERINELSQLARTAWFTLMGYLVFVGITLLGVKDADFFVPSRQTDLPLVNVAIPTASFFWTAPILGAALYIYLHLFLIKLWDAHGEARTEDADATHHWLVNDFALIRQGDPTARARPLWRLSDWVTRLLVWMAGPFVLAFAWWRSMPAHEEWLTLLIGFCLWLSVVVGFTSWWRAQERLRNRWPSRWTAAFRRGVAGLTALLLGASSWAYTEGFDPVPHWLEKLIALDLIPRRIISPSTVFILDIVLPSSVIRADLGGAELVSLPDDWNDQATGRAVFREAWCRREGLSMEVCDQPVTPDHATAKPVIADRRKWCGEHRKLTTDECDARFADLDERFFADWEAARASARANLPALDLRYRDLRRAHALNISLIGAILWNTRMQLADMRGARMEGADLSGAHMGGTKFHGASMEWSDLNGARMARAKLNGARIEGANFRNAQMERADLSGAQMWRASFRDAQMQGTILRGARMEETILWMADLRKSRWGGVSSRASVAYMADLRGAVDLTQAQLQDLIGDELTMLPEGNAPDTAEPYYIWNCWEVPPEGFNSLAKRLEDAFGPGVSSRLLCGDTPRRKLYNGRALDEPYPDEHPLAGRGNSPTPSEQPATPDP